MTIETLRCTEIKVAIASGSLQTATKLDKESFDLVTTIKLEAKIRPEELARMHYWEARSYPLFCIIGSHQAELDLLFQQVNIKDGTITDPGNREG